jgi:hypothetical protein
LIDKNNNSWDLLTHTEEVTEMCSRSLINCSRSLINCSNLHNCSNCSDYEKNPERITSPIIGSRHSNTTIYFDKTKTTVVCGCFIGTLEEFEKKIKEKYGNNEYAKEYFAWIKKVKRYISKPSVYQSYGEFKRKFEECYWEVKKVLRDFIKR